MLLGSGTWPELMESVSEAGLKYGDTQNLPCSYSPLATERLSTQ